MEPSIFTIILILVLFFAVVYFAIKTRTYQAKLSRAEDRIFNLSQELEVKNFKIWTRPDALSHHRADSELWLGKVDGRHGLWTKEAIAEGYRRFDDLAARKENLGLKMPV